MEWHNRDSITATQTLPHKSAQTPLITLTDLEKMAAQLSKQNILYESAIASDPFFLQSTRI